MGLALSAAMIVLLAGCAGPGQRSDDGAGVDVADRGADLPQVCSLLSGQEVSAARIGLPTRGATVVSTRWVDAPRSGGRNGPHCEVIGAIHADARSAATGTPDIRFEVNLPLDWNGRSVHMGGEAYDGKLVSGKGAVSFAVWPPPLSQGYATFGSDSGHTGKSDSAEFGMNDGALLNFGYAHLKKTHDVALAIIERAYGRRPVKSYFAGGSTGGREAMTVMQRYPGDYDGIVANAPAINFTGMRLIGLRIGQAAHGVPGGYLSVAALRRIRDTAITLCDADDGLSDGIVSNVEACRAKQEQVIDALRCRADRAGADCLTEAQLATARAVSDGFTLPYSLAHGVWRQTGYNLFQGADFSRGAGMGHTPRAVVPPTVAASGYLYAQGDAYLRFMIARDPGFDTRQFSVRDPGALRERIVAVSDTVGAMDADTSAFQRRGGKLILLHGLADETVSPNETIAYYRGQVARYGQEAVDRFIRFYTVPGFGHGSGDFIPEWPAMEALDSWSTSGLAPGTLTGKDANDATRGRTRPICRYPGFPRYKGMGDVNWAGSYICVPGQIDQNINK